MTQYKHAADKLTDRYIDVAVEELAILFQSTTLLKNIFIRYTQELNEKRSRDASQTAIDLYNTGEAANLVIAIALIKDQLNGRD